MSEGKNAGVEEIFHAHTFAHVIALCHEHLYSAYGNALLFTTGHEAERFEPTVQTYVGTKRGCGEAHPKVLEDFL